MNFSLIRLNPSQELKLVSEAGAFCLAQKTGRLIELKPLAAVFPAGREKEIFSDIQAFEVFKIKALKGTPLFYFPCRIKTGSKVYETAIPAAISFSKNLLDGGFDLAGVFKAFCPGGQKECGLLQDAGEAFFFPTSFCLVEAEIDRASWKFFDRAWKKLH